MVFRTVGTIEFVIRTHYGPGLGSFYGGFECRQVDFTERPLVYFGVDTETLEFLVVGDKVLY